MTKKAKYGLSTCMKKLLKLTSQNKTKAHRKTGYDYLHLYRSVFKKIEVAFWTTRSVLSASAINYILLRSDACKKLHTNVGGDHYSKTTTLASPWQQQQKQDRSTQLEL